MSPARPARTATPVRAATFVTALASLLAAAAMACASILGIQDITDDSRDGAVPPTDAPAHDTAPPPPSDASDAGSSDGCGSATDPSNCGQCGHSCLGSACLGGLCQPATLATVSGAHAIAADEAYAFWTVHTTMGSIMKANVDGTGAPQTLASGQNEPLDIVVVGPTLYWTQSTGNAELWTIPVAGGLPMQAIAFGGAPYGLAATSGSIYFSDFVPDPDGGTYSIIEVTGTPPFNSMSLVAASGQVFAMTSDTAAVYFTDFVNGYVLELPAGGSMTRPLATGQRGPSFITRDMGHVFWTIPAQGMSPGSIMALVPGPMASPTQLITGLTSPQGVAADGANVYWADSIDNAIYRVPIAGGSRQTIAINQAAPDAIALDSKRVFWVNDGNGTVMSVAK